MTVETYERTWDVDITRAKTGDGRTVTAYAAVFGQETEISDQHGHYFEELDRSSFAKTLQEYRPGRVRCFYNHGYDLTGRPNMLGAVPLGSPSEPPRVDARGLLTVTRYNKTALADAVLEAIDSGDIVGQSFRGRIYKSRPPARHPSGLDKIVRTELGLTEYGPTHSPAYTGAGILAVRSQSELADLIRSIMSEMSTDQQGQPGTAEPGVNASHSGRNHARRNAQRVRAIELGAIQGGKA